MIKKIWVVLIFFFPLTILGQFEKPVVPPTDKKQIQAVIHSVVQGIRQADVELITSVMSNNISDSSQFVLSKAKIKTLISGFLLNTEYRKMHRYWNKLSPRNDLPSTWDFSITEPEIRINGDQATAVFQFYWLMNIPLTADTTRMAIKQPSRKITETWNFKKMGNRWKITRMNRFLKIIKNQ